MDTAELIKELERDEAIRTRMYFDTEGFVTIGLGRNLSQRGITREEAYYLCNHDIDGVVVDLDQYLPWWRKLDEVRQRVLANMCYNLGIQRLLHFPRFLSAVQDRRFAEAAAEMKASKWDKQVGTRAARLEQMMQSGVSV